MRACSSVCRVFVTKSNLCLRLCPAPLDIVVLMKVEEIKGEVVRCVLLFFIFYEDDTLCVESEGTKFSTSTAKLVKLGRKKKLLL